MKTKSLLIAIGVCLVFSSYTYTESKNDLVGKVKISILYPNEEGKTFDMNYYSNNHMPMVAELFGDALLGYGIEKGISGRTPEEPLPYVATGYFYFDTIEDYGKAFGPNAEQILGDIPNYTNIRPLIQISEIVY